MATIDRVAGAALVVLALVTLVLSRSLPLGTLRNPGPAYMPVVLALILLVFGALLVLLGRRSPPWASVAWWEWRHAVAILGACVFAALALERLGYRLTVATMLAFLLGVVERKSALLTVTFAIAVALATFFLFGTLLRVPLPRGPLGL
jgi:hypothetical protein